MRLWTCPICGPEVFYRSTALQAHHVFPKSRYPDIALRLENGILVCTRHHQGEVHDFNASADVRKALGEGSAWERWSQLLTRAADQGHRHQFNRSHKIE